MARTFCTLRIVSKGRIDMFLTLGPYRTYRTYRTYRYVRIERKHTYAHLRVRPLTLGPQASEACLRGPKVGPRLAKQAYVYVLSSRSGIHVSTNNNLIVSAINYKYYL